MQLTHFCPARMTEIIGKPEHSFLLGQKIYTMEIYKYNLIIYSIKELWNGKKGRKKILFYFVSENKIENSYLKQTFSLQSLAAKKLYRTIQGEGN